MNTACLQHTGLRACALAATLVLGACNTVPLTPMDTGVPIVDASIRSDGGAGTANGPASTQAAATATPVAGSQVQAVASAAPQGLHLQAGAFSTQVNAEAAAAKVRSSAPALAGKVSVVPRGANFRVLVGPFADDKERQAAASAIRTQAHLDVANAAP